jgi:hypothetical protein
MNQDSEQEESATSDSGAQDVQDEDLQSLQNGANGLTFARVRSRGAHQEEDDTASELSFRPRVERPHSPESTSIPDDTPSIQVRRVDYPRQMITDDTRAPDYPLLVAVFPCHIAPCDHIDPPHYSRSSAASPRDFRPLHLLRLAHLHQLSCQRTRDSPQYLAIYSSSSSQTRRKLHRHHGR